jgi:hypothetical protein
MRNTGTTASPVYAEPVCVQAGGRPVEPFGMPSSMWGDFEGEGDRITVLPENSEFVTLKGGRSLNVVGGFSVGVGFMY